MYSINFFRFKDSVTYYSEISFVYYADRLHPRKNDDYWVSYSVSDFSKTYVTNMHIQGTLNSYKQLRKTDDSSKYTKVMHAYIISY